LLDLVYTVELARLAVSNMNGFVLDT
jgi:hypothetical protein